MPEQALVLPSIVQTFRKRAIRNAMLIDNMFPGYGDYSPDGPGIEKFADREMAHRLYEMFKGQAIPCEITNDAMAIDDKQLDRVRKSDLIILDFHLNDNDHSDASDSIRILAKLADSDHFNLVVVYTKEPDLEKAWLEITVNLHGGWKLPSDLFADNENLLDSWEDLKADGKIPLSSRGILKDHVLGTRICADERNELVTLGKSSGFNENIGEFIAAVIREWVLELCIEKYPDVFGQHRNITGEVDGKNPPWLLSGNVFVVLVNKKHPGEDQADDPEDLIRCLDAALCAWQPNVLRLLLSEIQNHIEDSPCAHQEMSLVDPATEAGWMYNILKTLQGEPLDQDHIQHVLTPLWDGIFHALKARLLPSELEQFAVDELLNLFKGMQLDGLSDQQLAKKSMELVQCPNSTSEIDIAHALNSYLSSMHFTGSYLTTGTVFCSEDEEIWWVCVSPSCDLEPRKPSAGGWLSDLHPVRPLYALRLTKCTPSVGLKRATTCRSLFLNPKGVRLAFIVFDEKTRFPSPDMFFVKDEGRVVRRADTSTGVAHTTFEAQVVYAKQTKPKRAGIKDEATFLVMAQLRDGNANRLLQQAGLHSSRIGVDFVNYSG